MWRGHLSFSSGFQYLGKGEIWKFFHSLTLVCSCEKGRMGRGLIEGAFYILAIVHGSSENTVWYFQPLPFWVLKFLCRILSCVPSLQTLVIKSLVILHQIMQSICPTSSLLGWIWLWSVYKWPGALCGGFTCLRSSEYWFLMRQDAGLGWPELWFSRVFPVFINWAHLLWRSEGDIWHSVLSLSLPYLHMKALAPASLVTFSSPLIFFSFFFCTQALVSFGDFLYNSSQICFFSLHSYGKTFSMSSISCLD